RLIAVRLDCREMHEHIFAVRPLDKAVSLGSVKPLHDALFLHATSPSCCARLCFPQERTTGEGARPVPLRGKAAKSSYVRWSGSVRAGTAFGRKNQGNRCGCFL